MSRRRRPNKPRIFSIYSFALIWLILSFSSPLYTLFGLLLVLGSAGFGAFLVYKITKAIIDLITRKADAKKAEALKAEEAKRAEALKAAAKANKKSYGPEIDPILEEGSRALAEMGKLYMSIDNAEIRAKINEIMRLTDKIVQDAIDDPSDIPLIKKFLNYYLPTTIKLLHAYDRMRKQGIEGENVSKSISSIEEMLDTNIEAYRKHLDSLFANQALDIETDIEVMNTLLQREGLTGNKDFAINSTGSAAAQKASAE